MIARLNLASDPFRNRTLPWTVAVVVSAVSLVAIVLTLAAYREAHRPFKRVQDQEKDDKLAKILLQKNAGRHAHK